MEKISEYLIRSRVEDSRVEVWEEVVDFPTYEVGKEENNPLFLEKRVYQGSSGSVYPYPVIERIYDEKKYVSKKALFLENEYIKIMILPELGGRIQMAYDKVRHRHFVYYNQVIKPALVGLTGPWISGGIEFNWPQHHRPTTFMPLDYSVERHEDGSATVWCSENERMFRTKGMVGFTLYPGRAYIELHVKVFNSTPFPQTFLWWANPAVEVNDDYYSVFPPDVHAVFDHGKRDVSSFPIAKGVYYKVDYSAGVDISRYKNIPVPTSYMAVESKYDFIGGYDEKARGGLLHVADHHISTGKKQWTWGNGDFGKAWDRNLTDEDGPYIELMTGVYTDNQPDFTWLRPYEEKEWRQYFMPYSEVGMVKNATREAVVNLEAVDGKMTILLYTTAAYEGVTVLLENNGQELFHAVVDVSPESPYIVSIPVDTAVAADPYLKVLDNDGRLLVSYQKEEPVCAAVPPPARAAKEPGEIESIEQLFLTGQHLEQYRHATYNPLDYYGEALRREPGDIRCNNAVGLLLMRRCKFTDAEFHFRRAIATMTERNPNPYDGEAYYNLGLCCFLQDKQNEAYDAFYKSIWDGNCRDRAYFMLARIASMRGDYSDALQHVEEALVRNSRNHKALALKAGLLYRTDRFREAMAVAGSALGLDMFNAGARFVKYISLESLGKAEEAREELSVMKTLLSDNANNYLEISLDLIQSGFPDWAERFLGLFGEKRAHDHPIINYTLGYIAAMQGDEAKAAKYCRKASQAPSGSCFPNKIEEVLILQNAMRVNPDDAKAPYYLGNFWYWARQYDDAVRCWELSAGLDGGFPTVLRNLALAYYNKRDQPARALEVLEKAFSLDAGDSRVLMELDQLYKKLRKPHGERLQFLEKHLRTTNERDDLFVERITLYNQLGMYAEAAELLAGRHFHPWEGGEGKVTGQYIIAHTELARKAMKEGRHEDAVGLLHEAENYPDNLGEGKLPGTPENDIHYYLGYSYGKLGDVSMAEEFYRKAICGDSEPALAFFYNDRQPDKIFYQGLAWAALGQQDKAEAIFRKLIAHGKEQIKNDVKIDYFAVSLPDMLIWDEDLNVRNRLHCNLVMGLGYMGLGELEKAEKHLAEAVALDINHQSAQTHLAMCREKMSSRTHALNIYNQLTTDDDAERHSP